MRRTIAWSYDLLSPEDQTLFRRLAIFVGGFDVEAAEAVGNHDDAMNILDGLVSLVDTSLLQQTETASGVARYSLLETVREYGLEQLTANGETAAIRDRHAPFYLDLAEAADSRLFQPTQATTLEHLETELPNLRAALAWLEATGAVESAVRLAGGLRWFWLIRGDYREGVNHLERVLVLPGAEAVPPEHRARALTGLGHLAAMRGDYDRAEAVLSEALELARLAGDAKETGLALHGLGIATGADFARVEAYSEAARTHFRTLATNEPWSHAWAAAALVNLGWAAVSRGELELALSRLEEVLVEARTLGYTWLVGLIMLNLGTIAQGQEDDPQALACYREALAMGTAHGDRRIIASALEGMAGVAARHGHAERSARLLGAAAALRERIGVSPNPLLRYLGERELTAVRKTLGATRFAEAQEAGRALSLDEAIAEAEVLADATDHQPLPGTSSSSAVHALSPREVEVLRLVAAGKTDAEIAAALFVSKRTVGTHLTNILAKLDLVNRAEAAAWAVRHGVA